MTPRNESKAIAGYRRVTLQELLAILREIEGMPADAVSAVAQAVWICVPGHPQAQIVWARATRALEQLRAWLVLVEALPPHENRVRAVDALLPLASESDGLGYSTVVVLTVDALRTEGLPLRFSRRRGQRGALEIVADVLYWVWRKPDMRARELRRMPESLGPLYWKAKKAKGAELRSARAKTEAAAKGRPFIWIPSRPRAPRSRIS